LALQTVCIIDIGLGSGTLGGALEDSINSKETGAVRHQDAFYAEVGRRVRLARERVGLTQDALAMCVTLSRTSVTNIEKGRQKVLLHTFFSLAEALSIEPAALLPDAALPSAGEPSLTAGLDESSRPVATTVTRKKRGERPANVR
jgi:transcriptional regulator with XRE-family HTH domain